MDFPYVHAHTWKIGWLARLPHYIIIIINLYSAWNVAMTHPSLSPQPGIWGILLGLRGWNVVCGPETSEGRKVGG